MRLLLFLTLFITGTALAGFGDTEWSSPHKDVVPKEIAPPESSPFDRGKVELEVGAGAFGSFNTKGTATRPDTGFAIGQIRFGWMLYNPTGTGFLRGNVEAILEGYGAYIFAGPGNEIVGGSIILRYNFVQPSTKIVPFIQLMGGGAYSDAAHADSVQRLLGNDWSFSFGGEVGLRLMLSPRMALTGGVEYRHVSNADLAPRNFGLNVLGGTLELSWFY